MGIISRMRGSSRTDRAYQQAQSYDYHRQPSVFPAKVNLRSDAQFPAEANPHADTVGPYDASTVDPAHYVDFGSIWVPRNIMEITCAGGYRVTHVDVLGEGNGQDVYSSLCIRDAEHDIVMWLQAFSKSRSTPVWENVVHVFRQIIADERGTSHINPDSLHGVRIEGIVPGPERVLISGVDSRNWFIRGIFRGTGLRDYNSVRFVEDIFSSIAVERGREALPPETVLPVLLPNRVREKPADQNRYAAL